MCVCVCHALRKVSNLIYYLELSENDDDDGEDKKSDYSDPAALICGIQATLDQLTTFQQQQQQQISGKIH